VQIANLMIRIAKLIFKSAMEESSETRYLIEISFH
jgi:hypothetical protein